MNSLSNTPWAFPPRPPVYCYPPAAGPGAFGVDGFTPMDPLFQPPQWVGMPAQGCGTPTHFDPGPAGWSSPPPTYPSGNYTIPFVMQPSPPPQPTRPATPQLGRARELARQLSQSFEVARDPKLRSDVEEAISLMRDAENDDDQKDSSTTGSKARTILERVQDGLARIQMSRLSYQRLEESLRGSSTRGNREHLDRIGMAQGWIQSSLVDAHQRLRRADSEIASVSRDSEGEDVSWSGMRARHALEDLRDKLTDIAEQADKGKVSADKLTG